METILALTLALFAGLAHANDELFSTPGSPATAAQTEMLDAIRRTAGVVSATRVSVNLPVLDGLAFTATIDGKPYRFAGKLKPMTVISLDGEGKVASKTRIDWWNEGKVDEGANVAKFTRMHDGFNGLLVVDGVLYGVQPGILIRTSLTPRRNEILPAAGH